MGKVSLLPCIGKEQQVHFPGSNCSRLTGSVNQLNPLKEMVGHTCQSIQNVTELSISIESACFNIW